MILIIDNYDSFTFNLYQYVGTLNSDVKVYRNDALSVKEIAELNPQRIILSPGPGYPEDAGVCEELLNELPGLCPILGVCLGHQAICTAYGGTVTYADRMMHGKTSVIRVNTDTPLFRGSKEEMTVGRYHSLAAREETLPDCLEITARTAEGEIMAVQHREYPVYGVQFHPESILTPDGIHLFNNFLEVMNHDQ